MIDPFFGMTCAAAIEAAAAFYALNGWRKAIRDRDIARDNSAHWESEFRASQVRVKGWQKSCELIYSAKAEISARLIDTEDRLRKIERQRSETTRKGNLTRYAKRREAVLAKAAEMQPAPEMKQAA